MMSGSVAEALLASGSKKIPLLPPPPKIQKEPKTFSFNLALAESNDQSYPEFSWTELVRNVKQKEISKRAETGNPTLDPFASDDEEDLKAMAARFEAKYSANSGPVKKKKRRVEDYIDKGAGYDETDPFIDNSDVYDEVVPADLQTVHGGFYINSGSLDFKEVELSEDEEESLSQPPKLAKVKVKTKDPNALKTNDMTPKFKNPVGRPPGVGNKRTVSPDKTGNVPKKRRIVITPVGPDQRSVTKLIKNSKPALSIGGTKPPDGVIKVDGSKAQKIVSATSSSSSSSSSTSESSSSSGSESSSSEETEEKKDKAKVVKNSMALKPKSTVSSSEVPRQRVTIVQKLDTVKCPPIMPQNSAQPKRLKTKNVPLNPKLHPNLTQPTVIGTPLSTIMPVLSQANMLNKDLIKANGGGSRSASPQTQSPLGLSSVPTSSPSIRVPTAKPVSTPSVSPGIIISPVNAQTQKPYNSNNITVKSNKTKHKPVTANNVPPITLDIFSLSNYTNLSGLSNLNFPPTMSTSSSIMKQSGLNMLNSSKAMPNLKQIASSSTSEKLVQQKQPKIGIQKPLKPKPKLATNNVPSTPSPSSAFKGSNSISPSIFANLGNYKTPPPLAGPGVEISKLRGPTNISSNNSTPKTASSSNTTLSPSILALGGVSLAHSSNSQLSLTNSHSAIISNLNSSPNLVNSVSSSLTVSRLPQTITITPSPLTMYGAADRIAGVISSSLSNKTASAPPHLESKPTKQISSFDMSALLQNSPVSYANMANATIGSKSAGGKTPNSIVNPRDLQRK